MKRILTVLLAGLLIIGATSWAMGGDRLERVMRLTSQILNTAHHWVATQTFDNAEISSGTHGPILTTSDSVVMATTAGGTVYFKPTTGDYWFTSSTGLTGFQNSGSGVSAYSPTFSGNVTASGGIIQLNDATGTSKFTLDENGVHFTVGYMSGLGDITIPSNIVTALKVIASSVRSGVSASADEERSGVSVGETQYGSVVYHNNASQLVYGLHPISGETNQITFKDISGTGITIYNVNAEPFQSLTGAGTSCIYLPPGHYREYVTIRAVDSGGTKFWYCEHSTNWAFKD